jgi:hypothetical protein
VFLLCAIYIYIYMFSASKSTCDSTLQKDCGITQFIFLHCVYGVISGVDVRARPSHFILLQKKRQYREILQSLHVYLLS